MQISKTKGKNDFSITGLTLGKLVAIQKALEDQAMADKLTKLGEDVLYHLNVAPFDLAWKKQAQFGATTLASINPYF